MRLLQAFALCLAASDGAAQGALTQAETDAFGMQIARCWNVVALTGAAENTVVTVRFELDRDGRPQHNSFALIGAGKDTSEAVKSAYTAAKRAIIRCGAKGYKLPLEKYDEWRNTELTFNPERMSLR